MYSNSGYGEFRTELGNWVRRNQSKETRLLHGEERRGKLNKSTGQINWGSNCTYWSKWKCWKDNTDFSHINRVLLNDSKKKVE